VIDEKLDPNGVVISSRIRLARNIADFPFVSTCSDDQRQGIESTVRVSLNRDAELSRLSIVDNVELETLERQFLLDLHRLGPTSASVGSVKEGLVDLASSETETKVDIQNEIKSELDPDCLETLSRFEDISLTINEEDHLRITITRGDSDLASAWTEISQLDDLIEQYVNYAFSPRWGYLTACPANVGTGMRVSVLVHLPALVITGQIDKVFRGIKRVNVVARGVLGDRASGEYFRVSNQATLGLNEADLIEQVTRVVPAIVKYECQAREFLLIENREGLRREVTQALDRLAKRDLDDTSDANNDQVMSLLSKVRMGISMGLLDPTTADRVNQLFGLVHLRHQLLAAVAKEDYRRASKLRDRIQAVEQAPWNGGESI
jgi:protein arginine kinase